MRFLKVSLVAISLCGLLPTGVYAKEVTVQMLNHAADGYRGYDPEIVHIEPGDSVHFVATDKGHNAEQIPGMMPDGAQPFSGKVSHDVTATFDKPGVYGYRCSPHYAMGMVGLVVVGSPVNEDAARNVTHPPDAKAHFDALFAKLDNKGS